MSKINGMMTDMGAPGNVQAKLIQLMLAASFALLFALLFIPNFIDSSEKDPSHGTLLDASCFGDTGECESLRKGMMAMISLGISFTFISFVSFVGLDMQMWGKITFFSITIAFVSSLIFIILWQTVTSRLHFGGTNWTQTDITQGSGLPLAAITTSLLFVSWCMYIYYVVVYMPNIQSVPNSVVKGVKSLANNLPGTSGSKLSTSCANYLLPKGLTGN